jgi:hypothetical protein
MNEETVKNSIIVPYFKSLGFDVSEIEYETSFSIRLGRFTHSIDGERDRASGRLDILYKKNGENLFVVETKPQTQTITENDKLQAISYARLLKEMAPFAVVTNGIDTKIYDVVTADELSDNKLMSSSYVKNGYKIALDSELKYRALKSFIGLNIDNLRIFCQKQLSMNMQNIIANKHNPEGKFVAEVYMRRNHLKKSFDEFLISDKKVFSIIGESGFGKTNAVCDLAAEYSKSNPILFFNGSQITNGVLDEIAFEFSWEFDNEKSGINIIKRMADVLIQYNKDVIIFIDAADESPNKDFALLLERFVKNCPSRVKLCVSCKESLWPKFLSFSGVRSFISGSLFSKEQKDVRYSFRTEAFSNSELDEVIKKYSKFYNLPEIKGYTRALCHNPLMLRALSEVYSAQPHIPENLITATVTKTFLDKKLAKSKNPDEDRHFLSVFGKTLFDKNKETLYEDEIPERLAVPDFLISFNLLRRTQDDMGRCIIGFQYDHIRDFVICFFSLKLDKENDKDLVELIRNKIDEDLPREILLYFERVSDKNKKNILRKAFSKYNHKRAVDFVDNYQQTLDTKFPAIRSRFYPYTNGDIGLLVFYHLDPYFRPEYGFREMKEGEPRVIWLEKENWYDKTLESEKNKIAQHFGVRTTFRASPDFTIRDPHAYAEEQIIRQLKNLVEKRLLDESNNINLLIEYILEQTRKSARMWGLTREEFHWDKIFPLCLETIYKKVEDEIAEIRLFCEQRGFSTYELPPDLLMLRYSLRIVKSKQETIEKTLLPFPSASKDPRLGPWNWNQYTDQEMIEYLSTLFTLVLREYKLLVETNFPTLKESMKIYRMLPATVIGEIEKEAGRFKGLTYYIVHGENANEVEIKIKGDKSIFDSESFLVHTSKGAIKLKWYSRSVMHLFFETDSRRDNIIQKRVYEMVYNDLKQLFK